MADTKVSALTSTTNPGGTDVLPIVQSATSKQIAVADLVTGGFTSITSAAGTTTLTSASTVLQYVTGSSTQTIVLPNATTLSNGRTFQIENESTEQVTIQTNGGATLTVLAGGTDAEILLVDNSTSAGTWEVNYFGEDGIIPAEMFCRLSANYTLTSTTSAQKLFNASTNGALTLRKGTYFFDMLLNIGTMSATSGNAQIQILGGGTAVIGSCMYSVIGVDTNTVTTATTYSGSLATASNSSTAPVSAGVSTAMATTITGAFTVTTAGTIIPSIALTTANAAVVQAGSYFKCRRVGQDSLTFFGNWS